MKKFLFCAAALCAFGVANAQDAKFGVKAGLNLANLSGDIDNAETLAGFHVGGLAAFKISEQFTIQPELLYSMQGAKSEYSEDFGEGMNVNVTETLRLGYLNVPIMAKYHATEAFTIQAGPQIGFLMSAKAESEFEFEGDTESEEDDVKDEFESIDFGLNFGVGYDFTENIFADARYNLGLSNIIKDAGDEKITNSVIQVSIGYRF